MLRPLELTTALRPSLSQDETLLFVQDAVGLYGGKAKLANYQNGQAYLTSHRVCYVDNDQPRKRAAAVDLKDVERCELQARFLKQSPKVTLIPKAAKFGLAGIKSAADSFPTSSRGSPSPGPSVTEVSKPVLKDATWVCPICSFSNPVPSNFDPSVANSSTALPPCLACGIKPPLSLVVKAAVQNIGSQQRASEPPVSLDGASQPSINAADAAEDGVRCPRCTFQNHPSLTACEICGTSLVIATKHIQNRLSVSSSPSRSSTPAIGQSGGIPSLDSSEDIKLSFRAGGDKIFHERLKGALTQRKWLINRAPPAPKPEDAASNASKPEPRKLGIAGLESRGNELRKNNEVVIGNAFEDLAALMASAKEIIALAETLNSQSQNNASDAAATSSDTTDPSLLLSQLNLTTTRDMLSTNKSTANLYLTELCRGIAEFLTDDRRALLKRNGGVMSLVDLWATFNRSRGGVELVSPSDFSAATSLFEKLHLPVRLRRFKSGLLVVQESSRTDDATVRSLLSWLRLFKEVPPDSDVSWDWREWGRGVTAQEAAERFGWSIGVASEELEMAEERGALCRESGIEGVKFWENFLGSAEIIDPKTRKNEEHKKAIEENMKQLGLF